MEAGEGDETSVTLQPFTGQATLFNSGQALQGEMPGLRLAQSSRSG
jgi:hypothetical protein